MKCDLLMWTIFDFLYFCRVLARVEAIQKREAMNEGWSLASVCFFVYCICALYPAVWSDLIRFVSLDRVRQLLHDQYLKIFTSGVLEGQFCWECTCSSQSIWCNCNFLWRWNSWALFKLIQLAEVESRVDKTGAIFPILFYTKLYIVTSSWSSSYEVNGCMPTNEAWHFICTLSWVS